MVFVFASRNVKPRLDTMRPSLKGYSSYAAERQTHSRARLSGKSNARPSARSLALLARPFEPFGERPSSRRRGVRLKSADADVNRMNFAPASSDRISLPTFLSASPRRYGIAVITGHVDRAIVAEEVGEWSM